MTPWFNDDIIIMRRNKHIFYYYFTAKFYVYFMPNFQGLPLRGAKMFFEKVVTMFRKVTLGLIALIVSYSRKVPSKMLQIDFLKLKSFQPLKITGAHKLYEYDIMFIWEFWVPIDRSPNLDSQQRLKSFRTEETNIRTKNVVTTVSFEFSRYHKCTRTIGIGEYHCQSAGEGYSITVNKDNSIETFPVTTSFYYTSKSWIIYN